MNATTPLGIAVPAAPQAAPAFNPALAPGAMPPPSAPQGSLVAEAGQALQQLLPPSLGGYFEMLAILFAVLALLWVFLWLLRKRAILTADPALHFRIEGRTPVGPKKWVMVGRFANKRLLIGVTDHHISLLAESPLEAEEKSSAGPGFASLLKKKGGEPSA